MQANDLEDMDGVMRKALAARRDDRSDRRELGLRDFREGSPNLSARRLARAPVVPTGAEGGAASGERSGATPLTSAAAIGSRQGAPLN